MSIQKFKHSKGRFGKELPFISPKNLKSIKRGTKVQASENIHSNGDVIVKAYTVGIIISRGPYSLNVQFDGYPSIVLCLWDMVEPINMPIQPNLFFMPD